MCFNEVLIRTSIPLCILIANKLRSVADPRYIVTQTVVGCSRRYQLLKKVGGGGTVLVFFFTSMIGKKFFNYNERKGKERTFKHRHPPPPPPHTQAYMSRQKRRKVDQNVDNAEDMNAHFNSLNYPQKRSSSILSICSGPKTLG